MTENTNDTAYNGGGLKGPLYWLAGAVTGKLALNALQGGGLGCVGGLAGGGNVAAQAANAAVQYELAKKDCEIALLKSGQETDVKLSDVFKTLRQLDKDQDAKIADLKDRVGRIEVAEPLREQIVMGKINETATLASNGIAANSTAISNLAAVVNSVVTPVVKNTSVCPGWGQVTITPQGPFPFPPQPGPTPA